MTLRILVVDDQPVKARLIERVLVAGARAAGIGALEVVQAGGVDAALAEDPEAFDAVASDWNMPNGGGLRVVDWALEHDLPVIVISGSEPPAWWIDDRLKRWAGCDYSQAATWLLGRACAGNAPLVEVCS